MTFIEDVKMLMKTALETIDQRSFTAAYNNTFELVEAITPEQKNKAFRLRYKIYCEEHGCECTPDPGNYMELDEFDDRAVHYLLMHRISGETVGTLRVVIPNDACPAESLPIQNHCDHPLLQMDSRVLSLCEISRFCMAARFRKRAQDGQFLSSYYNQDMIEGQQEGKIVFVRRRITYPQAALLRGAFEAALQARITECVWMVEPKHLPSLNQIGFSYRVLGPSVPLHGGLQPLIFNIKHVLDTMHRKDPACWDIVSDSGRLQAMADELARNDWQDSLIDQECREKILERLES